MWNPPGDSACVRDPTAQADALHLLNPLPRGGRAGRDARAATREQCRRRVRWLMRRPGPVPGMECQGDAEFVGAAGTQGRPEDFDGGTGASAGGDGEF